MKRALLVLAVFGGLTVSALAAAPAASAHPLGNATVNHYDGLHLYPDRLTDSAVEDIAEIPTLQRKSEIDTNGDGTLDDAERAAYAAKQCTAMAAGNVISVDGTRLRLTVASSAYSERPGAIQLKIGTLNCQLTAKTSLTKQATLAIDTRWDSAGIGWHEITAVATDLSLQNSPFPADSISDELQHYPNDMLSSPINVRSGSVVVKPGAGASTYAAARDLPVAGIAVRALNRLATAFNDLVGSKHLTVGVGLLAIALSMLLGAGHAFLPGHGKTIMAAYLVGRRGRLRDVVLVGATVTVTHTAGVLVLGLIISLTAAFSTTAAEQDLGVISGLIIAGVGLGLLVTALNRIRKQRQSTVVEQLTELALYPDEAAPVAAVPAAVVAAAVGAVSHDHAAHSHDTAVHDHAPHSHDHAAHDHPHPHEHAAAERSHTEHDHPHPHAHDHDHPHDHDDAHDHDHPHDHDDAHDHDHPHDHDDAHDHEPAAVHSHGWGSHSHGGKSHSHGSGFSRGGLVGLGVAGGLVPSPSALLVLLAAIALGRTAFGIILVLGYGLGMAGALTIAGLLLVKLRNRFAQFAAGRRLSFANRFIFIMPVLTAALVLIVGVGLTLRAADGIV